MPEEPRLGAQVAAEVRQRRRRPRRSSRRASRGRRCWRAARARDRTVKPRRRFSTPSSPFAPLSAAASGTATVAHASSSPSYAARRRAASGWVAMPRAMAIGTRSTRPSRSLRISTISCDDTSPCSRCHANDPEGASSPASDSSCSLIWSSAPSAAFRSANSCSAAVVLRAINVSTSSDGEPGAEALAERRERRGPGLELDVARRREVVAAVGRDERIEIRDHRAQLRLELVGRGEHALERGDVGVRDRAGLGRADVELVVQRDEAVDTRVHAFERAVERPVLEAAEDRSEVPAGRRVRRGHGATVVATPPRR